MRCLTRTTRLLTAGLVAVAAAGALTPAAQARSHEPNVPSQIRPPAGNKVFKVGHALGVQIYSCNVVATGGFAWTFVAPRANLFNERGKLTFTHFAGPTWQFKDGSQVVGQLAKPPVVVSPTAIPWLLLEKASTAPGPYGGDKLVRTTYIQRIQTRGGLAPAAATCNAKAAGTRSEVPYTADYYFWKKAY